MGPGPVTAGYVADAVLGHIDRLDKSGSLNARPVRLDGFSREEAAELAQRVASERPEMLVRILSVLNSEANLEVNFERATRYRNLVDAAEHQAGFILFVPLGQIVESSLDEPAFKVVARGALFRQALSQLRETLGLDRSELQGIRQTARYRQPESLFAFLASKDLSSGTYAASASHDHLGLLADSALGGTSDLLSRLQRNALATGILTRPGISSTRTLDDLATKVGLDVQTAGSRVLELQRWWRAGRMGRPPSLLDFGAWPLSDIQDVEIRWEKDLSRPPHVGFRVVNERTEVESQDGKSTVEWTVVHKTAGTRFELELVEDVSGEMVKLLGKTRLARRQIRWPTVFKDDEIRDRVQELNSTGELEGYLFRVRLNVYDGARWVEKHESEPFSVRVLPPPSVEVRGAAPTSYHALYEFHAARAIEPHVVSTEDAEAPTSSVRMVAEDGKEKEARLDVSPAMLAAERAILDEPTRIGLWRWGADGLVEPPRLDGPSPGTNYPEIVSRYLNKRVALFAFARRAGCVEAADLLVPAARKTAEEYVAAFGELVAAYVQHARGQGAVTLADRQQVARLLSADGIEVQLAAADGGTPFRILLVPPTHPVSVAWLLDFQDLIRGWTRGRFNPDLKPPYRADGKTPAVLGGVQSFAVGPRTMVLATPSEGERPDSWGYAGNLTATWQCFMPVGADLDMRARDWGSQLIDFVGLTPRPVGGGTMDPRRIGSRIKKYAVLHPYVSRLRIAAVLSGDGADVLDALRVIDEPTGTPKGAQTVREARYELTLIGPESDRFGRAIDELTLSPGDDRWSRYTTAILDNPETLLVPGFAYAKRPMEMRDGIHGAWRRVRKELDRFGTQGLHVTLIGPMLATSIGSAPASSAPSSFRLGGLAARPSVRAVKSLGEATFEGNWLLSLNLPPSQETSALQAASTLSAAVDVSHGISDPGQQVGLEIALAGPVSEGLRIAHEVSDWVIIADPLFSIELLDRSHAREDEAVLLDFTPEFDPYPGGRVVVTTRYLREVESIGNAVAAALSSTGIWTAVLESISARLLLSLANPTKQVVHGLAGLALSRVHAALRHPGSLVLPIDGHEDMFVFPKLGHGNVLADLLGIWFEGDQLIIEVIESKWTTRATLGTQVKHALIQAGTTAEALKDAYIEYAGVDRRARLDNLREVILFHLGRAGRHGLSAGFSAAQLSSLEESDLPFDNARVQSKVLMWCPDGSFGTNTEEENDGTIVRYFDATGIALHDEAMGRWPKPSIQRTDGDMGSDGGGAAIAEIITETISDDLAERQRRETETETLEEPTASSPAVSPGGGAASTVVAVPSTPRRGEVGAAGPSGDCIRLGSISPGKVDASWCPPRLSNGHLIIVGGSGAGKTTTLRHISTEIAARGVPVLVIDFHGDIELPGEALSAFEFDYSGNLNFVNPFHLDPNLGAKLTPSRLKWEFVEAWKSVYPTMGVHQMNFLANLIARAGITDDVATWVRSITFGDVLEVFDGSDAPDSQRAKIESYMKRFLEWRIFHGGSPIAVESFLKRSARLDLSQLDESARNILADVVLRRLFLLVRALGPLDPSAKAWDKFRVYVVIDEAQLLMGSSSDAKASLAKYAAEARKFGVGLILATQLRDNVPSEIWGNIDTRLFMQALDPTERARNAKAANVPEAMLRSLARGEAILLSSSQPHSAPIVLRIEPSWLRAAS